MLSSNKPINGRVHETENRRDGIEHVEMELFPLACHVLRQRHGLDNPSLDSALHLSRFRIVQMGESP
jgi:hypothetical protein